MYNFLQGIVVRLFNPKLLIFLVLFSIVPVLGFSNGENDMTGAGEETATIFLWVAIILIAAKLSGLLEKYGQPSVLGELLVGIIIGNLYLVNINFFEPLKNNSIIAFLSELGIVILLFQIGLESNIKGMKKVAVKSFFVATIGVIVPFILGTYIVGPWLLPGQPFISYLFLGLSLTATSVAVSARIFRDFGKINTAEAQVVLGAAVFDDILSLIILAVVSALASQSNLTFTSINIIIFKTFSFLIAAVLLSIYLAPHLFRFFSRIHNSVGMGFTVAISFGLIFAFFAHKIGLAPIVGAFAAGLVLEPGHFSYFENPQVVKDVKKAVDCTDQQTQTLILNAIEPHAKHNIENLFNPIGYFFIPIFFVMTGMYVKLESMFDLQILIVSIAITVAAFAGKIVSGLAAGNLNKIIIGIGMVPRGEVGLIFAIVGKSLGVVSDTIYSVIVIMIILTTILTPLIMTMIFRDKVGGKTCVL